MRKAKEWSRPVVQAWKRFIERPDRNAEREFLPAALELVETPASPVRRIVAFSICLFLTIAIVWASVGRIDIIATATGKVVPAGRVKVIQPLENGIVRSIRVQDGQAVKAGQILVELDATIDKSERNRIANELLASQMDAVRLRAALRYDIKPLNSAAFPEGATETQIDLLRAFLQSQLAEYQSKLAGIDQQISENAAEIDEERAAVQKLALTIPLLQRQYDVHKTLADEGADALLVVLQTQQALIEHQQDLASQTARLAQLEAGTAALRQQRSEAAAEYRRNNFNELNQAEEKIMTLQEQLAQAEQRQRFQTLKAPVDGVVEQLGVHTVGGVVTPAEQLMIVVPTGRHLEIEATISNDDIGFVHVGEPVEVKINTFNFTRYGYLHGKVVSVSRDAVLKNADKSDLSPDSDSKSDNSSTPHNDLVYTARVALERAQMEIDGRSAALVPGMAVTAEIKTGTRTVMSYLLSPIVKYSKDGLRER